jgi:EAL domain-containing protein (putative c-di-GMP-specific phosphodiesterase class I)
MSDVFPSASSIVSDSSHVAALSFRHRDALTDLPDEHAFELAMATRQATQHGGVPVALVELRGLARFNDHLGRADGDRLLRTLARRIDRLARDEFGPAAMVMRVSGARFALIPPQTTGIDDLRVETRGIVSAIGDALVARHAELLSLRMAVGTVASDEPASPQISAIARRLATAPALVRAIDIEAAASGEGLQIVFQPQFQFTDDRLSGAEALVRWHHPRLGEIGGGVLFAAAASAGLERRLSRAVWRGALAAMAEWPQSMAAIRVALNVTAADVADPAMADELLAMAQAARVNPDRLTVEVTEATLIERLDGAAATLSKLRAAGVLAALDDFGTGYSGLSWLRNLPVDYIKIDSGFARDANGGARDQTVLRGVIDIALALDLAVLAEGVETADQRQRLAALGCRWYQGYLRSPAITASALPAFLG